MATHSSILAQRIPWTQEPEGLQSIRTERARHDQLSTAQQRECIPTCKHCRNQLVTVVVILPDSSSGFLNHVSEHCFMTLFDEYDFYFHKRLNSSPTEERRKQTGRNEHAQVFPLEVRSRIIMADAFFHKQEKKKDVEAWRSQYSPREKGRDSDSSWRMLRTVFHMEILKVGRGSHVSINFSLDSLENEKV